MFKKVTSWIGILALVVVGLVSVAAIATIQEKFKVVIASDGEPMDVDPVALLRDDVDALRGDFSTLVSQLEKGIGQLSLQWDESSELDRRALEVERRALEERWNRLDATLANLQRRGATVDEAAAAPNPSIEASAESSVAAPIEVNESTAGAEPESSLTSTAKPRGGFLGFSLATTEFPFDAAQRFEVIGSLSRVGFDAKSTLNDFTGVTSRVAGSFQMALGDPSVAAQGEITAEAGSLRTGVEGRDEEMAKRLRIDHFPQLQFRLTRIDSTRIDRESQTLSGNAVGILVIAGKERTVEFPISMSVDPSCRVEIKGEYSLHMSDFGIEPPSQLGVISVEDEVRVWIALRARAVGLVELDGKSS